MLILTRKTDESILIGKDIKISIISVEKNKVRIGIIAPDNVTIVREELVEAVKEENKEAVKLDISQLDLTDLKFTTDEKGEE